MLWVRLKFAGKHRTIKARRTDLKAFAQDHSIRGEGLKGILNLLGLDLSLNLSRSSRIYCLSTFPSIADDVLFQTNASSTSSRDCIFSTKYCPESNTGLTEITCSLPIKYFKYTVLNATSHSESADKHTAT